uniref:Proteoglycan 4b n=1 Tax=Tetraodon nigroviridis TaxID=99883 RepID=H3DL89_TETNG
MMSSTVTLAAVFLVCTLTLSTGQSSCKGRCGTDYYRGYMCQCDYTCLSYDECCEDYESQCTTKNSCKGRCGEGFRRGRRCSCDPDCQKFKQCCSDFQTYCDAAEHRFSKTHRSPAEPADGVNDQLMPLVSPAVDPDDLSDGESAVGVTELETAEADAHGTTPASSDGPPRTQTAPSSAVASASTVGSTAALEDSEWTGSSASSTLQPSAAASKDVATGPLLQELLTTLLPAALGVTGDDTTAGATTNDPSAVTQKPGKTTSKDDSNDRDLCSGRPVSGVTTLRNGTMVVFRGHYFWVLDRNKVPGEAQGITQVWGVPSPIDTVFTRCNCQGKTYLFKGNQYWRFDNGVVDPGYPKAIQVGFDGLRGHITAALSVPQHRQRRESVYFFKRGGVVQKYSYRFTPSPTCGTQPKINIYANRNRLARQAAGISMSSAINIRASWRGFPTAVTAAVSVPNKQEPDGYKYYAFSRATFYTVRMDSERPALAAPAANTSPQNNFFKCP